MAVNCAAQGVVGLSVETRKTSTGKLEEILEAMLWISIHFFDLTRICASFVMRSGNVSQSGSPRSGFHVLRHLNLSIPFDNQNGDTLSPQQEQRW